MNTHDEEKNVVERLWALLARYCDEQLLGKLRLNLDQIRQSEAALLKKAKVSDNEKAALENPFDSVHLETIISECDQNLPKKDFLSLSVELASLCLAVGDLPRAEDLCDLVLMETKNKESYAVHAGWALLKRSEIRMRQAKWDSVLADLKSGKQHFTRGKNQVGLGEIENHLGVYYVEHGDLTRAATHFRKALTIFENLKDAEKASTVVMDLGILSNITGKWEEALGYYQRALAEFEKTGSVSRLAELHHNLGMTFLSKGDLQSAVSQFDESLTYSNQLHYQPVLGLALLGKASTYARMGDHPLSMAFANRALRTFRQLKDHLGVADTYKVKAIVQRDMKNFNVAELYLNTSIKINEEYENALNLAEDYFELGVLHRVKGDESQALNAFRKSLTYFKELGVQHELKTVQNEIQNLKK